MLLTVYVYIHIYIYIKPTNIVCVCDCGCILFERVGQCVGLFGGLSVLVVDVLPLQHLAQNRMWVQATISWQQVEGMARFLPIPQL